MLGPTKGPRKDTHLVPLCLTEVLGVLPFLLLNMFQEVPHCEEHPFDSRKWLPPLQLGVSNRVEDDKDLLRNRLSRVQCRVFPQIWHEYDNSHIQGTHPNQESRPIHGTIFSRAPSQGGNRLNPEPPPKCTWYLQVDKPMSKKHPWFFGSLRGQQQIVASTHLFMGHTHTASLMPSEELSTVSSQLHNIL